MNYKKKYKKLLKKYGDLQIAYRTESVAHVSSDLEIQGLKAENQRLNDMLKQQTILN